MRLSDTVSLLRALDPVQVPSAGRQRAVRPGRAPRMMAVAAVTGVVIAVGLVTTDDGRSPGLAAAAYAALTAEDRVVHLRLRSEYFFPEDQPTTTELWMRGGGRQVRVVYDRGATEFVRDSDQRYAAGYTRHRNEVVQYPEREMWEVPQPEELTFGGPEGAGRLAEALPSLLAGARAGDPSVRRLPDVQVDGRTAARLEVTTTQHWAEPATADARRDPDMPPRTVPVAIRTVVWLEVDTHLPRRIERFHGDRRESTTEVTAERLPVNDATKSALRPAYPGARKVVGGRSS